MKRPSTDDYIIPYNPVRWVCQYRRGNCDGTFYVSGYKEFAQRPCPLYPKCGGRNPQLETLHMERGRGVKVLRAPADPRRTRNHTMENSALERCFFGGRGKRYHANNRDRRNEEKRIRYANSDKDAINMKRREERRAKRIAAGLPVRDRWEPPPPPCGGDCVDNCPYGNESECCYPDWEEFVRQKAEEAKRKEKDRKGNQKKKERRQSDPVYAAAVNRKQAAAQRARRANETPAQREARQAKGRAAWAKYIANETPEHREARLERRRQKYAENSESINARRRETRRAKKKGAT